MAFVFNSQFDDSTERKMQAFFQTLSEKDRRRYAAMEAVKLGHGGIAYMADYIFKQELQRLVNEIGIEIRVAHYPTYCSKFNPIERRFFCHVTRACQGILFETLDKVVNLMRKTATQTGLSTTVRVMRKAYQTGRHATQEFRQNMKFKLDKVLPRWNYTAQVQLE